jgi:hypothetical protein
VETELLLLAALLAQQILVVAAAAGLELELQMELVVTEVLVL